MSERKNNEDSNPSGDSPEQASELKTEAVELEKQLEKSKKSPLVRFLFYDMPAPVFWVLLLLFTGFHVFGAISSWDLWWHLACGRYFVENGFYPPTGSFTFSDTIPSIRNPAANVWFGDIVLYSIQALFLGGKSGEFGLQLFRAAILCFACYVFIRCAGKKYNMWTLAGSVLLMFGTIQKHLIKNAIFIVLFLPLFLFIWMLVQKKPKRYRFLPWVFIPLSFLWNIMHGEVLVGVGVLVVFLFGFLIDHLLIERKLDWKLLLNLAGAVIINFLLITNLWGTSFNWGSLTNMVTSFFHSEEEPASPSVAGQGENQEIKKAVVLKTSLFQRMNKSFRLLFRGGDEDVVTEYQSPFDITFTLPAKCIFILSGLYFLHLLFVSRRQTGPPFIITTILLIILVMDVRFHYINSIVTIYGGFYFPVSLIFIAALTFFAYRVFSIPGALATSGLFLFFLFFNWMNPIAIRGDYLIVTFGFYTLFLLVIGVLKCGLKLQYELPALVMLYLGMGYLRTVVFPFLITLPIMAFNLYNNQAEKSEPFTYVAEKILRPILLSGMVFVFYLHLAYYVNKDYHVITGFIGNTPGIGSSYVFRDNIPKKVLTRLQPGENAFNSYNIGGYLIWQWYDRGQKVFIDGRSAIYPRDFFNEYVANNAYNWVRRHRLRKAIFSTMTDMNRIDAFMKGGWTPIMFDTSCFYLELLEPGSNHGTLLTCEMNDGEIRAMGNLERDFLGKLYAKSIRTILEQGRFLDAKRTLEHNAVLREALKEPIQNELQKNADFIGRVLSIFGNKNHPALGDLFKQLLQKPNPADSNMYHGLTSMRLGDYDKAKQFFQQSYNMNKENPVLLQYIGQVHILAGNAENAVAPLKQSVKLFNEKTKQIPAMPLQLLGEAYLRMNQLDLAVQSLQAAVQQQKANNGQLQAQDSALLRHYAVALFRSGNKQEALNILNTAAQLNPGDTEAQNLINQMR